MGAVESGSDLTQIGFELAGHHVGNVLFFELLNVEDVFWSSRLQSLHEDRLHEVQHFLSRHLEEDPSCWAAHAGSEVVDHRGDRQTCADLALLVYRYRSRKPAQEHRPRR